MFKSLRPTRWSLIHFVFLLVLLFVAVFFSSSQNPMRLKLQHGVFDQFNIIHPRQTSDKVVIIDIDEQSLEAIGQWPWPRNVLGQLTKSLTEKGAKAIAFDGVFAEEDRSSPHYVLSDLTRDQALALPSGFQEDGRLKNYDDLFAQEIKKSKVFVTAFTYGRAGRENTKPYDKKRIKARNDVKDVFLNHAARFSAAAVNLPEFSRAAAGTGSFMAQPDSDGVLRRVGMVFTDQKTLYPSLSLEALRVGLLGRKATIILGRTSAEDMKDIDTQYRVVLGEHKIPVEEDGILYVYYRYMCSEQDVKYTPERCLKTDYISAYKFLDTAFDDETMSAVKDKIVLIGASAEGLKDLRTTALQPFRPGVEVHANVIEQVLNGSYLLRPQVTEVAEASFILVSGLLFILVAPFIGIIVSIFLCATLISVAFFGAYIAYVDYGLLIDPVYPSLAALVMFIASTILSYARAEMKRKQIRNAFGMYVAGDVVKDLETNPDKLKLGGENRDLTVMFTDIRKFTSISEGLSPEELINLMNEFLTSMTDIVMDHNGTVDKYIGDAMMTFWNAPLDVKNHEREACLAALKMQDALTPINVNVKKRAEKLGKEPVLLQAGIGINTGPCAVGNMGSKQRFAYSALGDAVNLSSRLEGQTKMYGLYILVGESTYQKASDLAMLELDLIKVVGKDIPTRIYGLFGDENVAKSDDFQAWAAAHMRMLKAYRAQDFDKAKELITHCRALSTIDTEILYTMYDDRIQSLRDEALPKDWDGVFVAESK